MTQEQESPIDTSLHPIWGFFAIFSIGFPLFFLFRPPLPEVYDPLPELTLVDHKNQQTALADFQGQSSIVNFIFTRCQDVCPALSARMAYIQSKLPEAHLFSITVDPQYDTPSILQSYAKRFNASEYWRFLTGDAEQIRFVNQAFQQAYAHQKSTTDAPNILHSQKFILVDKKGQIRGFYDDNTQGLQQLMQDYKRLKGFF